MKASFTKGFAAAKQKVNKEPIVARIICEKTIVDFESAVPRGLGFPIFEFISRLARGIKPEQAFKESFNEI